MFRRLIVVVAAMMALTILLAACGEEDVDQTPTNGAGAPADPTATASPTEQPADQQPDLAGTSWQLSGFVDRDIDLDVPVTLAFEDGRATGNAGCNDYGAEYESAEDGSLSFGEIEKTEMLCEIGMDVEDAFLDALPQVAGYTVDDTRLELLDASGSTLLVFMQEEAGASTLDGTSWILSEFDGETVPEEFEDITLSFNAGDAGGTVCNSYGATYATDGSGSLTLTDLFNTEMYCTEPDGIMDLETDYLAALRDVAGYRIEGDTLTLLDAGDVVLMTFTADEAAADVPLDGTSWIVAEIDGEPVIEDSGVTMEFADGMVSGHGGCNGYGGSYTVTAEGELELRDITMTLMACAEPEGVMDQETAFHDALRAVNAYELDGETLTLLDDAGTARLVLQSSDDPDEPVSDFELDGTGWVLEAMHGEVVDSAMPFTLQFGVNGPSGKAGCLDYWADFTMNPDGSITPGQFPISPNDSRCEDADEEAVENAEAFIDALTSATAYAASEDYMQLLDDSGTIILEFRRGLEDAQLADTSWVLTSLYGDEPIAGSEVTLEFESERLTGNGGCNGYGGLYMVVSPGVLSIQSVDREEMACTEPAGVMEQETAYFDALTYALDYVMTPDSLTMMDADGETILTFEPAS